MISALIYFRSAIFHPDVNQYMDDAISYVEARLNIAIPSYVNDDIETIAETEVECTLPAEVEMAENDDAAETLKPAEVAENDNAAETLQVDEVAENDDTTEALQPEPVTEEEIVNELEPVITRQISDDKSDLVESLLIAIEAVNKKVDKLAQAREVVDQTPEIERNPEVSASAEDKAIINSGDASAAAAPDDVVKKEIVEEDGKKILIMARQSFWNGDVSEAENLYLKLIAIDASNPDVYGEIGNIYYTQGKWKQAGQAYYQAAIRLLAQQKDARASNQISYLLRVIQGLDTESAEKLRIKISE